EPARISEDVFRIRQVQGLTVFEERQCLVADQACERRTLEDTMARRDRFDGGQEPRRQIPGASRWPGTAAPGRIVWRRHPRITPRGLYVRRDRRPLSMMMCSQEVGRNDR